MNEIFSEKVVTSRRTYYFDVKETKEGARYLVIGELTQVGNETERHRVMVFEESLEFFVDGLDKAVDFILNGETNGDSNETLTDGGREEGGETDRREMIRILRRLEQKVDQVREHFR